MHIAWHSAQPHFISRLALILGIYEMRLHWNSKRARLWLQNFFSAVACQQRAYNPKYAKRDKLNKFHNTKRWQLLKGYCHCIYVHVKSFAFVKCWPSNNWKIIILTDTITLCNRLKSLPKMRRVRNVSGMSRKTTCD